MTAKKRKTKKRGITARWLAVILVFTVLILAAAAAVTVISIRQNYYSSARQILEMKIDKIITKIYDTPYDSKAYATLGAQRAADLRLYLENFDEKDKFEIMLINEDGRVIATSSGYTFGADEPLDDYNDALANSGQGYFTGYSTRREHIIAVTRILDSPMGDTAAIRCVSSLTKVDASLMRMTQIIISVCVVLLAFSIMTGMFFVRSIVIPLGKVGQTASRIAAGDYDVRVENKYNDEIGDLCDIINNMAVGLSASDRLKNEFISSVSHELRTPLTSIKGWGETIQSVGAKDEKILKKGMGIIINETERLSVLVEDLLDFSRLESGGKMKFNFEVVDIVGELRETAQIFEQRAQRLDITFSYFLAEEEIFVTADKNRIRQVFSNLIDNAIKYSAPKDTVTITLFPEWDNVKISIADMGCGIPEDEIASVTERFFKASNSVTGSGIGLAVVKEIIVMHEGTLKIDSELGKGTKMTVTLPKLKE